MKPDKKTRPKCSVPNCRNAADYKVVLYDFYPFNGTLSFEQDPTCNFICKKHAIENEEKAHGIREPRGCVTYPHTNRDIAQGFTIYQPLTE